MSRKFSTAQHNYHIFEMETLAILEALLKWEDKLIRNHLHMVTDHWALEFFKIQRRLSHRQMQWMEYFSRFDYNIQYVKAPATRLLTASLNIINPIWMMISTPTYDLRYS